VLVFGICGCGGWDGLGFVRCGGDALSYAEHNICRSRVVYFCRNSKRIFIAVHLQLLVNREF
jgi:hypothetical protein